MKNLLFFTTVVFIFAASSLPVTAQNQPDRGRGIQSVIPKNTPRFIEGIEIRGGNISSSNVNNTDKAASIPGNSSVNSSIETSLPIQFKYSQLLERNVESVKNISLFNFIEEWWDTPYRYGGSNKKGIDCSAFTSFLVSKVYDVKLPRTAKEQYRACYKIDKYEMVEGDMVFFNTRGAASHVGVYLGDGYFVHACTSSGVTINNLNEDYYSARFLTAGRLINPASIELAQAFFL